MYAIGDSVVAGLVPATSRRCCGRVSICEISVIALMCGKNAIPRVGGRHQAGHYTATKVAYLHGLYPLRQSLQWWKSGSPGVRRPGVKKAGN